MEIRFGERTLNLDWKSGTLQSLRYRDHELLTNSQNPLFTMRLRDLEGNTLLVHSKSSDVQVTDDGAVFYMQEGISVHVTVAVRAEQLVWRAAMKTPEMWTAEYLDFPALTIAGKLHKNGGDGVVLWSYTSSSG